MARTPDLELFWSAAAITDSVETEVALVFCPNCGTQNDSAATPCKNCGFRLSGVSASKFKGTMMLNSDQTVHELIEEHKKKKAEAALDTSGQPLASPLPPVGSTPPKATSIMPSTSAPPGSGMTGTSRPVFQPPRAGAPKRRMGGTMLGVAPQVGGVAPPPEANATPPAVSVVEPPPNEPTGALRGSDSPVAFSRPPEPVPPPAPLAGTLAMPLLPEVAPPVAPAAPSFERPAAGRTQPLAVPSASREESLHSNLDADVERGGRAPAVTAPLPQHAGAAAELVLEEATSPPPRRIRLFEIVLIVLTCGLYGIVVLLRQRKSASP